MFSTKEYLKKRTGKNKVERYDFLKLLVEEFNTTKSLEAKQQVLANLANFAYDPINYEFLRNLSVIELFLQQLDSKDENIVEYAVAGICNICLDFTNKDYIIDTPGGIEAIIDCLSSRNEETVISSLTILIFLITPKSKNRIVTPSTIEYIVAFSRNPNKRIQNLAKIFLLDYCTEQEVKEASSKVDKLYTS
uniref:Armadillo repeat-containing protein 7 n=1 Tax=Triatoma infestans TaxID=30076 RepID=A0A023F0R4_TRIIF